MAAPSLADRAAAIAAKARSYADAKGTTKAEPPPEPTDQPKTSGFDRHHKWRVYWPNGIGEWPIYQDVWIPEPMTQPEVMAAFQRSAIPLSQCF
jgi:hypothetical protein